MRNTIVAAIREMLERHWDVYEIAAKLRLDPAYVQAAIDIINNTLT
jgi:DNA-binding MarR family transcriptional regulator